MTNHIHKELEPRTRHEKKCPKFHITGYRAEDGSVYGICTKCGSGLEKFIPFKTTKGKKDG